MSTNNSQRLNQLIDEQQALLNSIKAEAMAFDADELAKQNEKLTVELEANEKLLSDLTQENKELKNQLNTTKSALFAKMANEKLSAFTRTQKRIDDIYYSQGALLGNRLQDYENNCKKSIDSTINAIDSYGSSQFNDILEQLNQLKAETEKRAQLVDEYNQQQMLAARATNSAIGNGLKNEPLTDAEKRTALKQKNLESFIGLNVLGKAGILLFIIGIIMLGRFAYVHMSDAFKGGVIYLLGAVLIAIGELFYKKEKTVFSTTLISGGVATLYAAAATCYFAFDLYGVKATFIICIAITAIAILLSHQVKSEVVCAFAGVGGYLPVVALYMIGFGKGNAAADVTFLPVTSVYFCLLAIVIFAMTYGKKWHIAQFVGYGLHLIAIGGIAKCAYTLHTLPSYGYALPLAAVFAVASFVIYLMMPSAKIVMHKPVATADSLLLALNTVSGAISVSFTVRNCIVNVDKANRAMGFVFLAFAVIYALLMVFSVREKKTSSPVATAIASVGALIFSMLVVPLIFGMDYAAIGWAIEGVILAIICLERNLKLPELAGLLCMALSAAIAIFNAFEDFYIYTDVLSMITCCVVLSAFWIYTVAGLLNARDKGKSSALYIVLELVTASVTACYLYYIYNCILQSPYINVYSEFTDYCVATLSALLLAIVIRMGILKNKVSLLFSNIVGVFLAIVTFAAVDCGCVYNEILSYFGNPVDDKNIWIINIVLLIFINIAVELFFARSALELINRIEAPAWIFTMAVSVSSLMLITATIMNQFNVDFSSVIISTFYIVVACLMLFIGFKRQYTVVRSGGLVLILCAFAKLCFVDTLKLDSGWKIASYFAFGAILIVISYFYQRFSKKLESDAVALVDEGIEE